MSVIGMVMVLAVRGAQRGPVQLPQRPEPVLWLHPEGKILLEGKKVVGTLTPGAATVDTPFGKGIDFAGKSGGLLLPDYPQTALTGSLTISTWVYLRSYVTGDLGSQIFFRGDDRPGLDPYYMAVLSDGTAQFVVQGSDGVGAEARAEVPLDQWIHLTGVFDAEAHEVRIWLNDRLMATRVTAHRPFADLDPNTSPGLGIGNVQHQYDNEALNGIVADLRVYSSALEPREAGYKPIGRG